MRTLRLIVGLFFLGPMTAAFGEAASFHAGIVRAAVTAETPFEMLVWYPTQADEVPWQVGPFTIPASRNAAVAPGNFPIVLLSHGGGRGGGSPLVLRELSVDLARHGFVVVAPFHGKTGLQARTRQVKLALEAVLADPRFTPHVDATRLGMLGFSLGTAVTLELAGAIPNGAHIVSYCAAHPDDVMSCHDAPDGNNGPAPGQPLPAGPVVAQLPHPLKAIALLDPFAVLFQQRELAAVTMPVLIFRPSQSELPGEANAVALAADLPRHPRFVTVPGTHFIFADVCPAALQSEAPQVCQDPKGVDRSSVHTAIEGRLVEFFRKSL